MIITQVAVLHRGFRKFEERVNLAMAQGWRLANPITGIQVHWGPFGIRCVLVAVLVKNKETPCTS